MEQPAPADGMSKRSKRTRTRNVDKIAESAAAGTVVPAPWFSRDWLWGLILFLAVVCAYAPVWWAGYIWDDPYILTENPVIIGPLGLKEIWTTSAADICPLTLTTFWVEHALWGLAPLPYHVVNVLLHGACAIILWRILLILKVPGAWFGAALWALHPVQVESVAWITEMKNTQSGLFFLLSVLFFSKVLKAPDDKGRRPVRWNYPLMLLCAALAMASKSSTVILPLVLVMCAWWVEGRWHWRNLTRVGPVFLMSIAAGVVSMWTQKLQLLRGNEPQWAQTWPERLVNGGDAVWFYLGKLLWPHPLLPIYPRWEFDAGRWFSYLPLLAVIVVLFILHFIRGRWPRPCFFAFSYFLLALLPVLGFVNMSFFRYSFIADHFQYLASIGPLALAGAGLAKAVDFAASRRTALASSLGAGLLLLLGVLSGQRAALFENEETLWTDTLAWNPNCWIGHYNLGIVYFQKGQGDKAIEHYRKALEINPDYAEAYTNLGNALSQDGHVDDAIVQYQKALDISPNDAKAHNDLGVAFYRKGQLNDAAAQYKKSLEINSEDPSTYDNLGVVYSLQGQPDEAVAQYQKALEVDPDNVETLYNLGVVLAQKGDIDDAISQYQKVIKIRPTYGEAYTNLGIAFFKKGQVDKAQALFNEAVRLNPNDVVAQSNLAKVRGMAGQNTPPPSDSR
jgi:tetratricopeptide (TPR) repeat protein